MPNLSQDIIVEILSRLPVKSVCRFRCVSKSWLHLTTQPHFIQTHLNQTQTHKLILSSKSNGLLFSLDHLAPIDDDLLPLELDFPLKGNPNNYWVQIFGSCNGLVCIMPQPEVFFIFNPTTSESIRLPDCPLPIHVCPQQEEVGFYHHVHSFGYSACINDYKFVKVAYGCMVMVFTLKTNSWKRVQDFPYKHCLDGSGTSLNGAVHWVCGLLGVGNPCVIAVFDLAEEKFSDLATPDSVTDYRRFTTGVLGGCLCLLHRQHTRQYSFWVMKEYNVKESWTRIFISDSYVSLKPLCYWKNTYILLARNRKQLLLCNTKFGTCKSFLVNGLPAKFFAEMYVESLVSPNFRQNQ